MSKKINSIVTSIAGVMVAIPNASHANIATTGYVNKIVNQTHAVGSALQFGLLSDNATPLFMLGATNQPTTGADGGSLVGSYGAISIERLGKHLAGFEGGNGSFVLVGDGTTTGTAGWMGIRELTLKIPGSYITGYGSFYIDKTDDSASAKVILGQNTDDAAQLKTQSPEWFRVDKLGKYLAGFDVRGDQALTGISHVLAGNGTTSGTAQWIKLDKFAAYMPGSQITGYVTGHGNFLLIGGGTETDSAGWGKIQDVLAGLRATGIDEQITNPPSILVRDNNFSNEAHWAGPSWLAEQLHGSMITNYGGGQEENTNGSLYLLGGDGTTSGAARWVGMNDFAYSIPGDYLAGFYTGFVNGSADYQQPMYIMGQGSVDPTQLSMQSPAWYSVSQLARTLSGFATGSGSHILVGDGTTSGTAGWTSLSTVGPQIAGYEVNDPYEVMTGIGQILMRGDADGHAVYYPTTRFTSFYVKGNYINGFETGSGSHVLVGDGTTTGTARWSTLFSILANGGGRMLSEEIDGFTTIGSTTDVGFASLGAAANALGSYIGSYASGFATGSGSFVLVGDGTTSGTAGWTSVQSMLLKGLTNNPITNVVNSTGAVPYYIPGTERVIWSSDVSELVQGNRLHYSELPQDNIGSRVLVEYKTDIPEEQNYARFTTVTNMLINGISNTPPEKVRYAIPTLNTSINTMRWIDLEEAIDGRGSTIKYYANLTGSEVGSRLLVERGTGSTAGWASLSTIGSKIGGFTTGSGSHILVGDGTTTGTAKWSTLANILVNDGGRMLPENIFGFTTIGSTTDVGFATLDAAAEALGSYIGSYASGFTTGSGAPTYILGTNTTGTVTNATMKLHAISGLGSEIKFTETKTAAEISASTGTVYFPVIQNGQIYGVTLNDFYILMNAKF